MCGDPAVAAARRTSEAPPVTDPSYNDGAGSHSGTEDGDDLNHIFVYARLACPLVCMSGCSELTSVYLMKT